MTDGLDAVDRSAFALRIRRLRDAFDLTQEAFADSLGVKRSRVASWENDQSFIRYPEVDRMRATYGVDADFILFGDVSGLPPETAKWLKDKGVA